MYVVTKSNKWSINPYNCFDFAQAINLEALEQFFSYFANGDTIISVSEDQPKNKEITFFYEWCPVESESGEEEWGWHTYTE